MSAFRVCACFLVLLALDEELGVGKRRLPEGRHSCRLHVYEFCVES